MQQESHMHTKSPGSSVLKHLHQSIEKSISALLDLVPSCSLVAVHFLHLPQGTQVNLHQATAAHSVVSLADKSPDGSNFN
ncbi:uncharacterized protein [Anser cygnoides]|uniref:uncharacterized protein isoform X2 n=1 Tax=Anser cygnoides TaxID=8845 RepID=UPI0034D2DB3B